MHFIKQCEHYCDFIIILLSSLLSVCVYIDYYLYRCSYFGAVLVTIRITRDVLFLFPNSIGVNGGVFVNNTKIN